MVPQQGAALIEAKFELSVLEGWENKDKLTKKWGLAANFGLPQKPNWSTTNVQRMATHGRLVSGFGLLVTRYK